MCFKLSSSSSIRGRTHTRPVFVLSSQSICSVGSREHWPTPCEILSTISLTELPSCRKLATSSAFRSCSRESDRSFWRLLGHLPFGRSLRHRRVLVLKERHAKVGRGKQTIRPKREEMRQVLGLCLPLLVPASRILWLSPS